MSATSSTAVQGSPARGKSRPDYDVEAIRREFPILHQEVHGHPLVYLDNAASTQKSRAVIEAVDHYYRRDNANIHRGVHELSQRATDAYEKARATVQRYLNAGQSREIVFVRGATEGINLVAHSLGRSFGKGDEIVISHLEHHSNIVPWQILAEHSGARLRVIPINDAGEVEIDAYEEMLSGRTRLVALSHVSNALGTVSPVKEMIAMAHRQGALALIDGAQAVQHVEVDVRDLDADFYVFSGHKIYAPTGIGALYAKADLLEDMPPYQGGGDMILSVSFEGTTYNEIPHKFEAGTPNIAGAIGLGAALDFMSQAGIANIAAYEARLLDYATRKALEIPGLSIVGRAASKSSVLSFLLEGVHPHDIGTILDQQGIAIRTGHHCAQPVMDRFGIPATARISLGLYNTREEIDKALDGVRKVQEIFS
ncbi:MAG TPA: cysteine desulfurase [Acidobacteriota bacterium]|nr:cysteine desulfurase [Acidobacteriota bacterium]